MEEIFKYSIFDEENKDTIPTEEIADEFVIDKSRSFLYKDYVSNTGNRIKKVLSFKDIDSNSEDIIFEIGNVSTPLCDGSIICQQNSTILLGSSVCELRNDDLNVNFQDGVDLKVEFMNKWWNKSIIPNNMDKRDNNVTENDILLGRIIDRSFRPLFGSDVDTKILNNYTIQLIVNVLSNDLVTDLSHLSLNSISIAINIMFRKYGIKYNGPIGAIKIGYDKANKKFLINPNLKDYNEDNILNLLFVGNKHHECLMIETDSSEIPDHIYIEALKYASDNIKPIISTIEDMTDEYFQVYSNKILKDKNKMNIDKQKEIIKYYDKIKDDIKTIDSDLYGKIHGRLNQIYSEHQLSKEERNIVVDNCKNEFVKVLLTKYPDGYNSELNDVYNGINYEMLYDNIFYEYSKQIFRERCVKKKVRCDGRGLNEVRQLNNIIDVIPSSHGSSIFERGNTSSICLLNIGNHELSQNKMLNNSIYKFMLNNNDLYNRLFVEYEMPPYSTNEVKQIQIKNRREYGHSSLIKKSLEKLLPSFDELPYTIKLISSINSSDGSSSMASICSGSLALMDGGINIKNHCAGISMGLIKYGKNNNEYVLLTDILGLEDHFGDMDFKIAGTVNGITGVQLDIKLTGVPIDILIEAIKEAKNARNDVVIPKMNETISVPSKSLKSNAPRIENIKIDLKDIPKILGTGGYVKKYLELQTNCIINIDWETENIEIVSPNLNNLLKCKNEINNILYSSFKIGDIVKCSVVNIQNYGVMVKLRNDTEHLVHISQWKLDSDTLDDDDVKAGDEIELMCIGYLSEGRPNLSRKAAQYYTSNDPDKRSKLQLLINSLKAPSRSTGHLQHTPQQSQQTPQPMIDSMFTRQSYIPNFEEHEAVSTVLDMNLTPEQEIEPETPTKSRFMQTIPSIIGHKPEEPSLSKKETIEQKNNELKEISQGVIKSSRFTENILSHFQIKKDVPPPKHSESSTHKKSKKDKPKKKQESPKEESRFTKILKSKDMVTNGASTNDSNQTNDTNINTTDSTDNIESSDIKKEPKKTGFGNRISKIDKRAPVSDSSRFKTLVSGLNNTLANDDTKDEPSISNKKNDDMNTPSDNDALLDNIFSNLFPENESKEGTM